MDSIKIHISTYEGNTSWVFPMKDSELDRKMKAMGFGTSNEIPIAGVAWPEGLYMLRGLKVDADELNFLAKSIDRFDESESDRFFAAAGELKNANVEDLINLSFNIEHYTLAKDVTNLAKIGKEHTLDVRGGLTRDDLDTLDFAQIGRKLLASGKGIPTNYGLLFENEEVPLETVYDGTNFPLYSYRGDEIAIVEVRYDGKSEYLFLPEENITIDKALKRLAAPSLEDCQLDIESFSVIRKGWQSHIENTLDIAGLHEANTLAEVLARRNLDQHKLMLAVEYAEVVDSDSIKKIADHLDDFIVMQGAETVTDVGEYIVQHESGYEAGEYLTDYIDYAGLGEYIVAERDGEFMGGVFVCMEDGCSYEQIMGCKSPDMNFGGM